MVENRRKVFLSGKRHPLASAAAGGAALVDETDALDDDDAPARDVDDTDGAAR